MTNTLPDGKAGASLLPGTQVGEYIIDAKLGEGGFGAVYRASHPLIGKVVAIKVLSRALSSDPEMVSRFVAEARAVNQIRHRNIVDIFAFGQLPDERSYYVMAMLEGESLADRLGRGPLEVPQAITVLDAIGRALDAAHAAGIVHRDLKPDNIFLARDGDGVEHPTLLDFGIAKLLGDSKGGAMHKTRTGAPIGTPHYMSPEQCRGRDVDHRTDVYSLGVVAYQCLVGAVPFDGEDYMEILIKQMNDAPPAPSAHQPLLGAEIDRVVHWMMAKDPGARPQAIGPAIDALAEAARARGHAITLAPRRDGRTPAAIGAAPAAGTPRAIGELATMASTPPTAPGRGTPIGLDATMAAPGSLPGTGAAPTPIPTVAPAPPAAGRACR
jgi:serine/threonine protein kinase